MAEPAPRGSLVTQWAHISLDPETQWLKKMEKGRVLPATDNVYHLGLWVGGRHQTAGVTGP